MASRRQPTPPVDPFAVVRKSLTRRVPARVEAPGAMQTSVALILTPGSAGLEALFIRRAEQEGDPWSGQVGLPGGRREAPDADLLATAVRETREEVGVALPPASLLGGLDDLVPRTPRLPPLLIRPYVFGVAERPAARVSAEVAGVMWFGLAEIAASAGQAEVLIGRAATEVDCFRPRGTVIWGLTYRMLRAFLALTA